MQNFRALGALPPNPHASGGWGLCRETPASGGWGLRPQTPIGLRWLGAPTTPKLAPPHCEFLAMRLKDVRKN